MGPMLCVLLVFSALFPLVGGDLSPTSGGPPCPPSCVCTQQSLVCTNMANIKWGMFLGLVPQDTTSLIIRDTTFPSLALPDHIIIPTFKHLKYLRITNCNITVVGPKAFRPFSDLIELHLDSDDIRELDADALHSLSSLTLLNLRHNVINSIHENTFQGTRDLKVLDLAYNQIQILYPKVFQSTEQLQMLNLTKNKVHYIHPDTFKNLTNLQTVDLNHNQLEVLHQSTFENLTSLTHVSAEKNPWSCDCGLQWLHPSNNQTHPFLRILKTDVRCSSPPKLDSLSLKVVSVEDMTCTSPQIVNELTDASVLRLSSRVLKCNVTGYPRPSVYWITPRGVLALPNNRKWMSPSIVHFKESHEFIGIPTLHNSKLVALEDGSLRIHQIRHYFAGRYTCVAENPAGLSSSSFNVTIQSVVQLNTHFSMFVGGCTAFAFLLCSIIVAVIRQGVYEFLKKRHQEDLDKELEDDEESACLSDGSPKSDHSWYPDYFSRDYISPYESPMKCTTPVEADCGNQQGRMNIRETLEDVRFRLRMGYERSVTRIRSGAQHSVTKLRSGAQHVSASSRHYMHSIRESSSQYMQTIRESGSHTIQNIRSSGSQYANRVRAGVVLSVEQVKYHVQSMKELCLTGNIGQTISTVSVATDVDSQEKTDVVKKITYV